MVVDHIEQRHETEGHSYRTLCAQEGLAYASVMRWKDRVRRGVPLVERPGPKKVAPFDLPALREQIRVLDHGRKRSEGAGGLYRQYRDQVSRRQLTAWVAEERQKKNRERSRIYHEVSWKAPRLVWAMDDTEYHPDRAYPKAYLHTMQDLGSRFKFGPLVGLALAQGSEIAAHLSDLFDAHGPPLFLKRDNAGNLNHGIVEEVLEAFWVIPVNSPCYYPQYNGGIEVAQREIKERLSRQPRLPAAFLAIQAQFDIGALNHRPRACLGHRSPCQVFTAAAPLTQTFNRRKRQEVYLWIREKTLELTRTGCYDADSAWRLAVETWLLNHGYISIKRQSKVLPGFSEIQSHH